MPWVCINTTRASWSMIFCICHTRRGIGILLAAALWNKMKVPIKIRDWDGRGSAWFDAVCLCMI